MLGVKPAYWWLVFLCVVGVGALHSLVAKAQLLPDNRTLNAQSVERWMKSSRPMAPVMALLDAMHDSAETLAAFDQLAPLEQDRQIDAFLREQHQLAEAQAVVQQLGWRSVGEYQRLGSRLGNAIAAYFLAQDMQGLNEEQRQLLRQNSDPVLLAVPAAEIAFVQTNEAALQQYIRAYAAGR